MIDTKRDLQWVQTNVIVAAILSAGKLAGGGEIGDDLKKILKSYEDLLYPENAGALQDAAARTQNILAQEYARGPMKVKALSHSKKKKKRG